MGQVQFWGKRDKGRIKLVVHITNYFDSPLLFYEQWMPTTLSHRSIHVEKHFIHLTINLQCCWNLLYTYFMLCKSCWFCGFAGGGHMFLCYSPQVVKALYSGTQRSGPEVLLLCLMTFSDNSVFIYTFSKHLLNTMYQALVDSYFLLFFSESFFLLVEIKQ